VSLRLAEQHLTEGNHMAGQWGTLVALSLAITASACVPIPYKPSASVNHVPVTAEEASAITVSSNSHRAFAESLAKSIRQVEPRIVLIDGGPYLTALQAGHGTLAEVLARNPGSPAAPMADYLLCVGSPVHRQLHDTGAAAPFPLFPVIWVGYEKVQSRDSLTASLIDLHGPQGAESLEASTTYSEVIAAAVYGVATIARPHAALRDALAADVARKLASALPRGAIRLIVLAQDGGTAEPDPKDKAKSTPQPVVPAQQAAR
jgi:hypothetical protein